jgi:hypothetical protein
VEQEEVRGERGELREGWGQGGVGRGGSRKKCV